VAGFRRAGAYLHHRLDLRPELNELFESFHKSSVQRRIRRAERANLIERCGRSEALLKDFYGLLVKTRSRHHLLPQPYDWFRNLINCLGDALDIRVAYKEATPVAAVLNLRFKEIVVFKYGCSDARYHHLGAIPFLLWRTIEQGKSSGATEFDMGRSDEDNLGLIVFKNRWAHMSAPLVYRRFSAPAFLALRDGWKLSIAKRVFGYLPKSFLVVAGKLIYRHIG